MIIRFCCISLPKWSKWTFLSFWSDGFVWCPFWMNYEIFVGFLMSEEEILIAKFGSGEFAIHDEVADVWFFTTKFLRLIPGPDFVKVCVSWNFVELIDSRVEIFGDWKCSPIKFLVHILMWLKSQFEWEVTLVFFFSFFTSFIIFSAIWKSYRLNVLSSLLKFSNKSFNFGIICWPNIVVGEIFLKEVPIGMCIFGTIITVMVLTVDRVHSHKVARVLTISKEFKTKSWHEGLATSWFNSRRHSDKTGIGSFEDSCICAWLVSFEGNFWDQTYWVNPFNSFASPVTWHQITSCIESWIHWLSKHTNHLPLCWKLAHRSISNNLAPKLISLIRGTQWKILDWSSFLH